MPYRRLTPIIAMSMLTLILIAGCGSATKSGNGLDQARLKANAAPVAPVSGQPLSRDELVAKGNLICKRLNIRRNTTKVLTPLDYERSIPALASYEMAGAAEMLKLVPPPSIANEWRQIATSSRTIAEVTGYFHTAQESLKSPQSRALDVILTKAIDQMKSAARHAKIANCAVYE